jgi:hypothetical protein
VGDQGGAAAAGRRSAARAARPTARVRLAQPRARPPPAAGRGERALLRGALRGACAGARAGGTLSAVESGPSDARETVAGFLAAAALFVSLIGVAYRPARLIPVAIVVALVSARMTERHSRLAAWAVGIAIVCWTLGMTVAVVTENPLY